MSQSKNESTAWLHMLPVGLAFAFIIYNACSFGDQTGDISFYASYTGLAPIVIICSCWAAIGPGSIVPRLATFSSMGPVVAVAGYLGLVSVPATSRILFNTDSHAFASCMIFMIAFGLFVACQIPFWLFKFIFGWRLTPRESAFEKSPRSIGDLFVLTALFALALALPGYAFSMAAELSAEQVQVGYVQSFEEAGSTVSVEVTEENLDEMRKRRAQASMDFRGNFMVILFVYSAVLALIALFFSPAIWFALRLAGTRFGLVAAAVYLEAIFIVPAMATLLVPTGLSISWTKTLLYVAGYATVFSIAGIVPLLISRRCGIRLVTNRDLKRKRLSEQSDSKLESSENKSDRH